MRQLIEEGKTILIKEALANGRLLRSANYSHYEPLYRLMVEMAFHHGVGPDAIALRFVMDNLGPNVVLSGASTPEQLDENLKALSFQLGEKEIGSLRKHSIEADAYWTERKRLPWN
jgi:aryl-alcohol dehydrogenase-like predicted oxidoreductase